MKISLIWELNTWPIFYVNMNDFCLIFKRKGAKI